MSARISQEEISLFDILRYDKLEDSRTFSKSSNRGLWKTIIEQYPESAHFIYELLQNADDAKATYVEIIVSHKGIIFKHNGAIQFSVTSLDAQPVGHINSITSIGDSSKDGMNTIGKFGIGFKSVFTYTDAPEIYDDKFWFRLDNYIVPTLLEKDHDKRKEGETLFWLPFRDGNKKKCYEDVSRKIRNLDNPILFLDSIESVIWRDTTLNKCSYQYKKIIEESHKFGDISGELLSVQNSGKTEKIWMFHRNIRLDGVRHKHRISVGYYMKENEGKYVIDTTVDPKVFCFFPTSEKFHQKRVMHAPFLLTASRSEILEDNEINEELIDELAKLSADSLVCLRDIGISHKELLIDENILDLVCIPDFWSDPYPQFTREYMRVIKSNNLLITKLGKYTSTVNARIAQPVKIQELISDKQLTTLQVGTNTQSLYFVFPSITQNNDKKRRYLIGSLGVEVVGTQEFARCISERFLSQQNDAWLHKFYAFIKNEARELWNTTTDKALFRYAPIIRTNKGEFVAPYIKSAHNVFMASSNIDADKHIVDISLLKNKATKSFFEELGIGEMKSIDQIASIAVKHESSINISSAEILQDTHYICELFFKSSSTERKAIIEKLSNVLHVAAIEDGCNTFTSISNAYDDNTILNHYFKGNNQDCIFRLNYKFYAPIFKEFGREDVLEVFYSLGLRKSPKIAMQQPSLYSLPEHIKELIQKNYSTRGYAIHEVEMHGLTFAINHRLKKEISLKIWEWLSDAINAGLEWQKLTYNYFYRYLYKCTTESSIYHLLTTTKWIYVASKPKNVPSKFSRQQLRDAGYCENERLYDILGVKSTWEDSALIPDEVKKSAMLGEKLRRAGIKEEDIDEFIEQAVTHKESKERQKQHRTNEESLFTKEPLRKADADEMFSIDNDRKPAKKQQSTTTKADVTPASIEERMGKFLDSQKDALEQEQHIEELRSIAENSPKYSKEWFEALLELEYKSSKEDITAVTSKAISISFQRVEKETGSDRIFVLNNPAKPIPLGIEEVGGLTVKFHFSHKEDIEFSFEVASVRDFTLRLKAKLKDIDDLDKIDWTKCTFAEININNPVELIGKLRGAFTKLELPNGFNLKDNIRDDIEFVFGPPGTGKTTYLSKYIHGIIGNNHSCKILVLAPTNKACDVLTTKVMSMGGYEDWLRRFVACGDQTITNQGVLCDRESDIYNQEQCCIVSTIARLPYDGFSHNVWLKDIEWDYVIIDEASMIPLAQIVYAIYKFSKARIIVAGDPFQISPIVRESMWEDENIYTMVNLNSFVHPNTEPHKFQIKNLDTQYRSLPAIGTLFSEYAYDGMLKHFRHGEAFCNLELDGLNVSTINFVPFRVEKYDNIFGPRKLGGSNVQIYSVLLTVEFVKYMSQQWNKRHELEEFLRIGVICPYAAQAQLIDTMFQQSRKSFENVEVVSGTIHGFQGDECDVIITVLNTPKGLNGAADKIFLNRKNILNVAISRAKDYLFVFMPHMDTYGYDNLFELKKIGSIAKSKCKSDLSVTNADEIEKIIFNDANFIMNNTFVTSHQMANVYTDAQKLYEVRIDETAVDIQINSEFE